MPVTLRPRHPLLLLVALAWLATAAPVAADAELTATFPEAGSTVDAGPRTVAARFSQELGADSELELFGPDGASVATGGLDPADARRLLIRLDTPLPNGEYEARYEVFSADGHLVRGTFTFTVAAAAPSTTPSVAPSASAPAASPSEPSATSDPTERPLPSPTGGGTPVPTSGADLLIPIVAVVVLVGGLGVYLLRGRR